MMTTSTNYYKSACLDTGPMFVVIVKAVYQLGCEEGINTHQPFNYAE